MQKLIFSAAFVALLTAPALAQHEHHGGPGGGPAPGAAPAAPAAAPHAPGGRGGFGHGPGGGMHGRPQVAPGAPLAAAPAPQMQARPGGNRHGGHDDHRGGDNNRPGFNPGDHTRPTPGNNNNRPGFRPGDHTRPTPGFGNRPGNPGSHRPGSRPNFSGFSRYHQNFNASRRFHAGAYHRPSGWSYRRWSYGQILPALFWGQQYWLNDYAGYDLPPPPYGAVWVRYGDDAILIDRDTGEIITVEYGVFY